MTYEWDHFEINFYYPSEVEAIFRAWATPRGLKSFFIEELEVSSSTKDVRRDDEWIQSGDSYSWRWRHGYALSGQFKNVIKNQQIEFTFGSMSVAVLLKPLKDSVLLQLKQTDIPTTEEGKATSHMNCRVCWTFSLTNLKSMLLTGTDLRDDQPERASSFEVGYRPLEL